jgi:diacylglycerol kinase family enzyme
VKALPEIIDREAREVTLHFPRKTADAASAIDGELVELDDAVRLQIHPGALQVVMPKAVADAGTTDKADIVFTPA